MEVDKKALQEEFLKEVMKDPQFIAKMKKRNAFEAFKLNYNLSKSTPMRCPVCNQYGVTGGSLWAHTDDPHLFTCRKCHLTFNITCLDIPIEELPQRIKNAEKEGMVNLFNIKPHEETDE